MQHHYVSPARIERLALCMHAGIPCVIAPGYVLSMFRAETAIQCMAGCFKKFQCDHVVYDHTTHTCNLVTTQSSAGNQYTYFGSQVAGCNYVTYFKPVEDEGSYKSLEGVTIKTQQVLDKMSYASLTSLTKIYCLAACSELHLCDLVNMGPHQCKLIHLGHTNQISMLSPLETHTLYLNFESGRFVGTVRQTETWCTSVGDCQLGHRIVDRASQFLLLVYSRT